MKQEETIKEWPVRAMSKAEVAMAYAPHLTPHGAVNRLMDWIRRNGELIGAHEARELKVAIGLLGLVGVDGVLHHGDTVLDFLHVVNC